MEFVATVAPFSEEALLRELEDYRISEKRAFRGKVVFDSSPENGARFAFGSRIARRVLMPLRKIAFSSKEDYYEGAKNIPWEDYFNPQKTFAVRVKGESRILRNSAYSALLLKDAVVDRLREKLGKRPSVDKVAPNISIQAFLENEKATISLDVGGPLHKRGYRKSSSPGALNETLAAVLLELCEFRGEEPFVDPMAGSGTIGIEAGLIAANVAPGLLWRYERGFFSFQLVSERSRKEIVKEAKEKIRKPEFGIFLSDIDRSSVKTALSNAKNAGISGFLNFEEADFFAISPRAENGLLLTNMPYGDHTSPDLEIKEFYKKVGDKLKTDFKGFRAGLLVGGAELQKSVGLHAFKKFSLYNGKKEVKLCLYELYEGSKKTKKE